MKERKQNWEKEFDKEFWDIDDYNCQYCDGAFGPRKGNETSQALKHFIKNQRKQACLDMIKYMEEKAQNRSLKDAGSDFGIVFSIEAAKEYLKTL